MKRHIVTVLAGAAVFFGYCTVVVPRNTPQIHWYQYPVVLPIEAGLAGGRSAHEINAAAVVVVLALECFAVGLAFDVVVSYVLRRREGSVPPRAPE